MTEAITPTPPAPKPTGLALLRQQVDGKYIAKLPKPTRAQTDAVKADFKAGKRCNLCGTWHHPDVVHLDYVGHAATTARLLEADENWNWEPVAWTEDGMPRFDKTGGLWIKLTICGVTRLGYGHADEKTNADKGAREKEVIGDAIRNGAMRFGWALDLWHKGGSLFEGEQGFDGGGDGSGDTQDEQGSGAPPSPPAAKQPQRRAPAGKAPVAAGKNAAAEVKPTAGAIKNLQGKIAALKLIPEDFTDMMRNIEVPEDSAKWTLAQWQAVRSEVDRRMAS